MFRQRRDFYKLTAGFTLVELLVVMGIIALLAVLGGANYITSLKRGRDATRKSDLEQVRAALEMYRTDNSTYPDPNNNCASVAQGQTNYAVVLPTLRAGDYLNKDVLDPQGGTNYIYCAPTGAPSYTVCADLEIDPGTGTCNNVEPTPTPLVPFDYGVNSP